MTINVISAAIDLGIRNLERPKCSPVSRSVNGLPMMASTAEIRM